MEAAVTALLELLDDSGTSLECRSAAVRRIRAERNTAQSDTAAVSDRAVQRLLAHVHVRCNPAEGPSVLSDRLFTAKAAVECVWQLLLHPQYAASAALRTRESVYALFDALAAVDGLWAAARNAGAAALHHWAETLARLITAAAASISGHPPRLPERAGWPPAGSYCDGLLRPGVITALLNAGKRLAVSGQSDPGRNPVSAARFWLQQLISNRRPGAGSAGLIPPIPATACATDDPNNWAVIIGSSLKLRLRQLPAAA